MSNKNNIIIELDVLKSKNTNKDNKKNLTASGKMMTDLIKNKGKKSVYDKHSGNNIVSNFLFLNDGDNKINFTVNDRYIRVFLIAMDELIKNDYKDTVSISKKFFYNASNCTKSTDKKEVFNILQQIARTQTLDHKGNIVNILSDHNFFKVENELEKNKSHDYNLTFNTKFIDKIKRDSKIILNYNMLDFALNSDAFDLDFTLSNNYNMNANADNVINGKYLSVKVNDLLKYCNKLDKFLKSKNKDRHINKYRKDFLDIFYYKNNQTLLGIYDKLGKNLVEYETETDGFYTVSNTPDPNNKDQIPLYFANITNYKDFLDMTIIYCPTTTYKYTLDKNNKKLIAKNKALKDLQKNQEKKKLKNIQATD